MYLAPGSAASRSLDQLYCGRCHEANGFGTRASFFVLRFETRGVPSVVAHVYLSAPVVKNACLLLQSKPGAVGRGAYRVAVHCGCSGGRVRCLAFVPCAYNTWDHRYRVAPDHRGFADVVACHMLVGHPCGGLGVA